MHTHQARDYLYVELSDLLLALIQLAAQFIDTAFQGENAVLCGSEMCLLFLYLVMQILLGLLMAFRLILQLLC